MSQWQKSDYCRERVIISEQWFKPASKSRGEAYRCCLFILSTERRQVKASPVEVEGKGGESPVRDPRAVWLFCSAGSPYYILCSCIELGGSKVFSPYNISEYIKDIFTQWNITYWAPTICQMILILISNLFCWEKTNYFGFVGHSLWQLLTSAWAIRSLWPLFTSAIKAEKRSQTMQKWTSVAAFQYHFIYGLGSLNFTCHNILLSKTFPTIKKCKNQSLLWVMQR